MRSTPQATAATAVLAFPETIDNSGWCSDGWFRFWFHLVILVHVVKRFFELTMRLTTLATGNRWFQLVSKGLFRWIREGVSIWVRLVSRVMFRVRRFYFKRFLRFISVLKDTRLGGEEFRVWIRCRCEVWTEGVSMDIRSGIKEGFHWDQWWLAIRSHIQIRFIGARVQMEQICGQRLMAFVARVRRESMSQAAGKRGWADKAIRLVASQVFLGVAKEKAVSLGIVKVRGFNWSIWCMISRRKLLIKKIQLKIGRLIVIIKTSVKLSRVQEKSSGYFGVWKFWICGSEEIVESSLFLINWWMVLNKGIWKGLQYKKNSCWNFLSSWFKSVLARFWRELIIFGAYQMTTRQWQNVRGLWMGKWIGIWMVELFKEAFVSWIRPVGQDRRINWLGGRNFSKRYDVGRLSLDFKCMEWSFSGCNKRLSYGWISGFSWLDMDILRVRISRVSCNWVSLRTNQGSAGHNSTHHGTVKGFTGGRNLPKPKVDK